MPKPPAIGVVGLTELRARMKLANADLKDLREAGLEAAQPVIETAHSLVPNLTGALEASLRAAGQVGGAVVRAGFASLPYAGPIHFGWPDHNIEPHPFLYDALDQRREEVVEIYQKNVDAIVDTI